MTGSQVSSKVGHLTAQVVDRSVQPVDSYVLSANLSVIKDKDDRFDVEINATEHYLNCLNHLLARCTSTLRQAPYEELYDGRASIG